MYSRIHFRCTNMRLQLHKFIQNCTFCVELQTKKPREYSFMVYCLTENKLFNVLAGARRPRVFCRCLRTSSLLSVPIASISPQQSVQCRAMESFVFKNLGLYFVGLKILKNPQKSEFKVSKSF